MLGHGSGILSSIKVNIPEVLKLFDLLSDPGDQCSGSLLGCGHSPHLLLVLTDALLSEADTALLALPGLRVQLLGVLLILLPLHVCRLLILPRALLLTLALDVIHLLLDLLLRLLDEFVEHYIATGNTFLYLH